MSAFALEAPAPPAKKRGYMAKAKRNDTNTPEAVLQLVRHVFGGRIDLDPCGNPASITQARREIWLTKYSGAASTEKLGRCIDYGSGLVAPWAGTVFVNPPFDHIAKWSRKCAGEHAQRQAEVLLLSPARTDTRWFHGVIAPTASAFCLWRGRLVFLGEKAGCPFPLMFAYWGPHADRFRAAFSPHGLVLPP